MFPAPSTFSFGNETSHPWLTLFIVVGVGVLLVLLGRIFWRQVKKMWAQAKQGGAILATPRRYLTHAFLPSLISWLCKLGVIVVFLAAYGIAVTFESVIWVRRLQLARQHPLVHAGRGRHQAGDERARAEDVL